MRKIELRGVRMFGKSPLPKLLRYTLITILLLMICTTSFSYSPSAYFQPLAMPKANTQIPNLVPLEKVKEIALKKATEEWGTVTPGEPIPTCDPDGDIIAYICPFAIGVLEFPDYSEIISEIMQGLDQLKRAREISTQPRDDEERRILQPLPEVDGFSGPVTTKPSELEKMIEEGRKLRWGIGRCGMIIVSATYDMFPIPGYAEGLPKYYTTGFLAREKATLELGNTAELSRIFFLGPRGSWFEFKSDAGDTVLIHAGLLEIWTEKRFRCFAGESISPSPGDKEKVRTAWEEVKRWLD